jgi:hypothetical protein
MSCRLACNTTHESSFICVYRRELRDDSMNCPTFASPRRRDRLSPVGLMIQGRGTSIAIPLLGHSDRSHCALVGPLQSWHDAVLVFR